MTEQLKLPLTEQDQKYLDEALAKSAVRNRKFFEFHGLTDADVEAGDRAYQTFLREDDRRGEKGFFQSPLGRKAFIVGWFIGGQR